MTAPLSVDTLLDDLDLTEDGLLDVLDVVQDNPRLAKWLSLRYREPDTPSSKRGWGRFVPRPDNPAEFDQQHSFCYDRVPVAFLLGGNASGTTECAAYKTAMFLLQQQPPPRKDTPFWVASDTYEQVMEACWAEKLDGQQYIPKCEVEWDRVRWHDSKSNHPTRVPLKPWPGRPGKNWSIEFKSFDQGRNRFEARSIGGFWFSEQFPHDILTETLRGCREYMFPGGQFVEFTPIDPDLCVWTERLMDNPPPGWKFYRCNTECNQPNLANGWFDQYYASIADEMVDSRKTGALAVFEGAIYQSFDRSIHVVDDDVIPNPLPVGMYHARGLDWGASEEHPLVCIWGYRDGLGDWHIYDEYFSIDQTRITEDHAAEIRERSEGWGYPVPGRKSGRHGPVYADPSRPGEIAEFGQRGVWCVGAANDVYKGINCVRALLKINAIRRKPRLYIHRRCKHLVESLRKYRWKQSRAAARGAMTNPEVARPVPLKKDDDPVDALRYLLYTESLGMNETPASTDYREQVAQRKSVRMHRTLDRVARGLPHRVSRPGGMTIGNGNGFSR